MYMQDVVFKILVYGIVIFVVTVNQMSKGKKRYTRESIIILMHVTVLASLFTFQSNSVCLTSLLFKSSISSTLCTPKKRPTLLFSISLSNINRFSKFFHWHILWTISNKVVVKYLTKL